MYVNTNISAMNAQRQLYNNNLSLDKSLERLSSGLRINTGADDASGLAIAEKMSSQGTGLTMAIQNTQDGNALFKIADGALDQVGKMLTRLEELMVRANNRTLVDSDRATIQNEVGQLIDQISTVSNNTEYNTLKLLDGGLDIKKSLTVTGNTINGSMKILDTPGTVKTVNSLTLSITSRGTPALASAVALPIMPGAGSSVGIQNTININGVDIQIESADTINTVISKINQANSKTNVIAIRDNTGRVGLVTGKLDIDAANVVNGLGGATAANGSAIGYTIIGSAALINLGGDIGIWSHIGFTGGVAGYNASGTNVAGLLGGITMQGSGNVLEMKDAGSPAYGIKVGTNMFNGAYGGYVLTGSSAGGTVMSSVIYITSATDTVNISTNDTKKLGIQLGANYNQSISYSIQSISPDQLGQGASSKITSLKQVSVITAEDANLSLKVIQKAITDVTDIRANLGSKMNRLGYTEKTLRIQKENMASAESKIRDADMALEMTQYSRNQILVQTANAMLAQANSKQQNVLQLLK
ncbi:MAG: flagellin [Candidatus Wallbacteria bacterium]